MPTMPAGEPTMQDVLQQIADLRKQLKEQQRRGTDEPMLAPREDRAVFSHPSAPTEGMMSPPWSYRRPDGYLVSVMIDANGTGSGKSTLRVVRRGIGKGKNSVKTIATVDLDKDDDFELADDIMSAVDQYDRISIVFDKVGAGLSDVTVTLGFMESVN